ncbi:serine hydrolase domain-containing protein [Chitinophaga rhizophila]|uniref:serine hydrolase domain-containing protein n=1 Tax=Chitinophaga rhizophila TaxID=2866212 RepID=UPI00293D2679|nr:serine hydrolase domain-containing protein [Chitinophaga rhizophila]
MVLRRILLLLWLVISAVHLHGQSLADTVKIIERIFSRYQSPSPGGQLAVSRDGKILFSQAWGMADLERQVVMSKESVIEAGSVSKQFTAAAVLLLEQQGMLKLSDEVHRYLPELPDYGVPISLSQMLHHTSGLKDWGSLVALSDWPRGTKVYSNPDVLNIVARQPDLNHNPGEEFMYSNSNYVLLAMIVERVSGESLAAFTKKYIFSPAGMTHSSWRTDVRAIVPWRAIAYSKNEKGYFTDMPNENVYGNGGLLTTAEDLLKWNVYCFSGKPGGPSLLSRQLETVPLNSGIKNNYSAGLRILTYNGQELFSHDGATAAYRALLEYYPLSKLSIAWLSNTSEFDEKGDGTAELRDLLVKKAPGTGKENFNPEPTPSPTPVKKDSPIIPAKELNEYTGKYYSQQVEAALEISLSEGKLIITRYSKDKYVLVPISADEFLIADSKVKVAFLRKKRTLIGLSFTTPRVRNVQFNKINESQNLK